MPIYSDTDKQQAVARARAIGTRAAARELGIEPSVLKEWRRAENRARRDDVHQELDALEAQVEAVADLAELQRIKRGLAKIARELNADPERHPIVYLFDDAA